MSRQETEEVDRLWRHAARLLDEVDSARAERDRYRLAWTSARRRAKRYDDLADELDERCAETRAERDEARAEVVRLGKENEEHRRTIRLLQDAYQEAQGISPAIAEVFGCPTCRTILNAERAGGCRDEWHHANRQAAATARLRAALDEERIEPEPTRAAWCEGCGFAHDDWGTEGEAG